MEKNFHPDYKLVPSKSVTRHYTQKKIKIKKENLLPGDPDSGQGGFFERIVPHFLILSAQKHAVHF